MCAGRRAQPDRLTNAAYNLRYKETLGRILLCFAPSASSSSSSSRQKSYVGDAARAFHAAFFPAFIGCAAARCSPLTCGTASSNV